MAKPLYGEFDLVNARWQVVSGPEGDELHVSFIDQQNERYTLLRDKKGTILIYDQNEWLAFINGVKNDEFG